MLLKHCLVLCFIFLGSISQPLLGQEVDKKEGIPPIQTLRAAEDYSFLDQNDSTKFFLSELKWIPLGSNSSSFLTLGGEYRPRLEHFSNKDYSTENETAYSQRLNVHAALKVGKRIRVFAEFYHGYYSVAESLLESDQIDLHQGFIDWGLFNNNQLKIDLRLGRQEIGFGASRLVGIREGPNLRRSFDMAKFTLTHRRNQLELFYGKEVQISASAFDNEMSLFNDEAFNPSLWGIYWRRPFLKDIGKIDFYYFGFQAERSGFNDVFGSESRHSIGLRSFGKKNRLNYNTELIYQFGSIENSDISAFNFETDWQYLLSEIDIALRLGLKLDFSSGDQKTADGKIQTFNPMFVNPAIYSLAAVNTPANLIGLHPNFSVAVKERLSIYMDYAIFFRTQANDGLYNPPRFINRPAQGINEKHIGNAIGLQLNYELNRNISFDWRTSYFIAGDFITASGPSENIFYTAPTFSLRF